MAVEGGEIPPALLTKPTLTTFDVEVWNAFTRLSARRSVSGFGAVSAIPYVEIAAYLDLVAKIDDPEDRADFIDVVEHLDANFLREFAERQKEVQQKSSAKRPRAPRSS